MNYLIKCILASLFLIFHSNLYSQEDTYNNKSSIFEAIRNNDFDYVRITLKEELQLEQRSDKGNLTVLEYIIFWHKNELFQYIIDSLITEDLSLLYNKHDLFRIAILGGNVEMVKNLLSISKREMLKNDLFKTVSFFIENFNISKSFKYNTSEHLKLITKNADLEILKLVIDNELFDINSVNEKSQTLLYSCLDYPHMIDFLIDRKINLNHIDIYGKTILDYQIHDLLTLKTFSFNDSEYDLDLELNKFLVTKKLIENGAKKSDSITPWCFILNEIDRNSKLKEKIEKEDYFSLIKLCHESNSD